MVNYNSIVNDPIFGAGTVDVEEGEVGALLMLLTPNIIDSSILKKKLAKKLTEKIRLREKLKRKNHPNS